MLKMRAEDLMWKGDVMSFQSPGAFGRMRSTEKLKVKPSLGLSAEEAKVRLEQHGPNLLQKKKKRGVLDIFLDQFRILWSLFCWLLPFSPAFLKSIMMLLLLW